MGPGQVSKQASLPTGILLFGRSLSVVGVGGVGSSQQWVGGAADYSYGRECPWPGGRNGD